MTTTLDVNRLAAAVSRRLGTTVVFLRWEPSTRKGGPESPIFGVPSEFVGRAADLGLDSFQFESNS